MAIAAALFVDQVVGGRVLIRSEPAERMMFMSTYEEFSIILTVALLIVSILNVKNKK